MSHDIFAWIRWAHLRVPSWLYALRCSKMFFFFIMGFDLNVQSKLNVFGPHDWNPFSTEPHHIWVPFRRVWQTVTAFWVLLDLKLVPLCHITSNENKSGEVDGYGNTARLNKCMVCWITSRIHILVIIFDWYWFVPALNMTIWADAQVRQLNEYKLFTCCDRNTQWIHSYEVFDIFFTDELVFICF